jgi:AraC-like DNA-binding protein
VVRYQPRDELRALLSHHAVLEWDLGEREGFAQKALDKPGSGIVWNKRGIAPHGPKTELYAYHGQGTGRMYGIKFGPAGERVDMATLAYDLGYSSQSHFSNHFKPMTNTFPSEYVRVRRNSEKK